jgi:hypothetical protein
VFDFRARVGGDAVRAKGTRAHRFGAVALAAVGVQGPAAGPICPRQFPVQRLKAPCLLIGGFYFGGHVGYATARSNFVATTTGVSTPPLSGSVDLFNSFDAFKGTGNFQSGPQ